MSKRHTATWRVMAAMLCVIVLLSSQALADTGPLSEAADSTPPVSPDDAIINIEKRIIGGEVSRSGDYPWLVALAYNDSRSLANRQFCGGTLIASNWVLTAAHCLYDRRGRLLERQDLVAATGVTNLELDTPEGEYTIANIILHPVYDNEADNPINDIALLELANHSSIAPLFVSKVFTTELVGLPATIMGWGITDNSDPENPVYPVRLNEVDVPIISPEVCNSPISYAGNLIASQLCAGFIEGGKDSCTGDSGGPLIATIDGIVQQVGIVSFGNKCAQPNFFGVYTNLPFFIAWINQFVNVGEPAFDAALALAGDTTGGSAGMSSGCSVGGDSGLWLLISAAVLLRLRKARQ